MTDYKSNEEKGRYYHYRVNDWSTKSFTYLSFTESRLLLEIQKDGI